MGALGAVAAALASPETAERIAIGLAQAGYAVITGGGPGTDTKVGIL